MEARLENVEKGTGLADRAWMNVTMKAALITGAVALYIFVETGTRDQLSSMEDRLEARILAVETRIDRVETRIDRVETRIDRVETRIDEVIGFLKYNANVNGKESPPAEFRK